MTAPKSKKRRRHRTPSPPLYSSSDENEYEEDTEDEYEEESDDEYEEESDDDEFDEE